MEQPEFVRKYLEINGRLQKLNPRRGDQPLPSDLAWIRANHARIIAYADMDWYGIYDMLPSEVRRAINEHTGADGRCLNIVEAFTVAGINFQLWCWNHAMDPTRDVFLLKK